MVVTALQSPKFYSNTQVEKADNMNSNQGGINQNVSNSQIHGGLQAVQGNNNQQNMKNKTSKFDLRNAQFAGGLVDAETVNAYQIGGNITNYAPEQKQNLAEAAAEIQKLLYQLSQNNPTTTEAVTEAIHQEIKRNPTLRARLQSALKAGGLEALKAIFNHPLFSIPAETIKGWLEAE
ncbi:hypothetical protein A6770_26610 [Nostoc minutum NIES-26]|uniref:Pentapeptide repeat-containing protein n=1 Tax=Nostoc minutum NIES-26 TaxID=1844469 RepID=A0A367QPQ5_9NOSO|nr:hypothetical protein A6770_26610 [Nostoc minutum NIES-26]